MPFEILPINVLDLFRHWGQPHYSAIPSKRVFTYRHALFRAEQLGIPFKMPKVHPFNSSKALRLAVAAGGRNRLHPRDFSLHLARRTRSVDGRRFRRALFDVSGLPDGAKMIELEDVKARLAGNLQRAIDLGVFEACRRSS